MSEGNSPTFAMGLDDGALDELLIKSCPSEPPIGPRPPFPDYPVMYRRGYYQAYTGDPHVCTKRCRRREDQHNRAQEGSDSDAN